MKKISLHIVILLLLGVNSTFVFAQQKDFGLWTAFELEKDLSKNLELDIAVENRLKDNLNQRDESFINTDISYRFGLFAAGFGYRLTNNNEKEENYGYSHRFHWQFRIRPEWQRFSFDYRIRFQSQYFNIQSTENGFIPENYLRNKIKADYTIRKSKFEPSVSYELFYFINQTGNNYIHRKRFSLEMEYKINKNNSFQLSYIIHETINEKDPVNRYILGIGYKLEI